MSLRSRHNKELDTADPNVIPSHPETSVPKDRLTLTWAEIPAWQKDNEYIRSGYRRVLFSWRGCAYSIFGYLHNETVNIQTHLFGAILFIAFLGSFQRVYFTQYNSVTWIDYTVFAIFLSSAVLCLLASSFYHTFHAHSREVSVRCNAVDYAGIVVLIVGSFFPCIYYEFFCNVHLQIFYLTMIVLVGMGAAYIVLDPEYGKPSHRGARTKVFAALGLSAVFPVAHGIVTHGLSKLWTEIGFGWLIASGCLYLVGAALYANRIPERLSPGTFDFFCSSHQIFHVCVVLAALSHYACVLTAFDHWHRRLGQCAT